MNIDFKRGKMADNPKNYLLNGDCLELMQDIPDKSMDAIICDLPYGTTACKWDSVIPFEPLWEQYNRIIKDNGAIVLFGSEPFSSHLRMSNIKNYKYDWTWKKSKPNGFQHSKNKPMKAIENIMVFSNAPIGHKSILKDKRMEYNPQGLKEVGIKKVKDCSHRGNTMGGDGNKSSRPNQVGREYMAYTNFPSDFLEYGNIIGKNAIHPTQKPLELIKYLVRTYTNENDWVLDNTCGSNTTGIACYDLKRNYIGIEKDIDIYNVAKKRVEENILLHKNKPKTLFDNLDNF